LLGASGSCLACPFFSFHLAHSDNFVFARWSLPTLRLSVSDLLLLQVC
jgi:hypothetical protein